jgi:alcohol dehydrogenase class IV
MSHHIVLPRILEIGRNARSQLPEVLTTLGVSKPLIITDRVMLSLGYVDELQKILTQANISTDYFADTIPEPTASSIAAGVKKFSPKITMRSLRLVVAVSLTVPKRLAF